MKEKTKRLIRCQNVHFNRKRLQRVFAFGGKIWRASKNSQSFAFFKRERMLAEEISRSN
jgi:hypothetical protein